MSVFTLDLNEADRAQLEAHRVRLGLRSHAETIRELIRIPAREALERAVYAASPDRQNMARAIAAPTSVPTFTRKAFNPQPKKGKK